METSYQTYINKIKEVEKIEEVVIKDNKIRRCCNSSFQVLKCILFILRMLKKSK